jgi:hypothetical protein
MTAFAPDDDFRLDSGVFCIDCMEYSEDCSCSGVGGHCGECGEPEADCECECGYCRRVGNCCVCDDRTEDEA